MPEAWVVKEAPGTSIVWNRNPARAWAPEVRTRTTANRSPCRANRRMTPNLRWLIAHPLSRGSLRGDGGSRAVSRPGEDVGRQLGHAEPGLPRCRLIGLAPVLVEPGHTLGRLAEAESG